MKSSVGSFILFSLEEITSAQRDTKHTEYEPASWWQGVSPNCNVQLIADPDANIRMDPLKGSAFSFGTEVGFSLTKDHPSTKFTVTAWDKDGTGTLYSVSFRCTQREISTTTYIYSFAW
jgi:hypothetical protein